MSNLEAKQQSLQEQQYHEAAAKAVAKMELRERRRNGQGELLGDMIGSVGAATGTGIGRYLVVGCQLFMVVTIGLWFAYLLWQATN